MITFVKRASMYAAGIVGMAVPAVSMAALTGTALDAQAVTDLSTGAQDVIDLLTEQVGNNIEPILILAGATLAVGFILMIVRSAFRIIRG